jgi:PIN domain nuclease of toxin-antitoxin system
LVEGPYLFDTSTAIWALAEPELLSVTARKALRAGPCVISVVTYWEVVIKSQKGLLKIADPVNWWKRASDFLGGSILSIRSAHITALAGIADFHKDPFDRMLIAQAAAEGLTLVTNDAQIARYSIKTVW